METFFGTEMPIAAKILLALLIVIGLAGVVFYVVRYAGASRFGVPPLRGRQPRLALIEVAGIDTRRSLVLIRRDNVEHLLMIGGPTDVVVEPNIVRAVAVGTREAPPRSSAEAPARSAATDTTLWPPLQPESPPRPPRQPPEEPVARPPQQQPQAQPLQPQAEAAAARVTHAADHLAGLAAELGRTATQSDKENAPLPPREPKRAPQVVPVSQATAVDPNLTEMAQRLEAALRHSPGARSAETTTKPAPEITVGARMNGNTGAAEPARVAAGGETKAPRPEAKATPPKAVYDSLEAEMASLLGRPAVKT
jgi:flagellar protein FliO/FliZ